jgi:DNA-binding GntR family transcriptional regulator
MSRSTQTVSLADQTFEAVKAMIFNFEMIPGERFSEADLTAKLKVSRTPLRQALQRLAGQGLLRVLPKMGWFVAAIDFDTMDELYDLRIVLECEAVRHLMNASDMAALDALSAIWLAPTGLRSTDGAQVGQLDESFHATLVCAAGNREMSRVHQEITERIRLIRRLDFTKPDRVGATYDEHAQILRAVRSRRRDEAQRLLKAHIQQSKLEVRKITVDALYRAKQARLGQSNRFDD